MLFELLLFSSIPFFLFFFAEPASIIHWFLSLLQTIMFQISALGAAVIVFSATFAAAYPSLSRIPNAGITCLNLGSTATAKWTTAAGQTCTWTGVVGRNFGISSLNGREYVHGNSIFLTLLIVFDFGNSSLTRAVCDN